MNEEKSFADNLIIERRKEIIKTIAHFFPNCIAKIISEYDYHLIGKKHTIKDDILSILLIYFRTDD